MFNKLKSAVTNALPGNPLSRDFDMYGQIGSAGPGLFWRIYSGMKKTTKQEAAIFVFEKKSIEKLSRRDKDFIMEALRKGASQLTRLRHPKILSVMQPLEESREYLAFATEPVFGSLANILGNRDNMVTVPKEMEEYEMFEVEIKYGLMQVTDGLQFLHNDAKLLHNNICPESIIISKSGSWKLAGFDFCVTNQNTAEQAPLFPYKDWDPDIPPSAQPNLDYRAPEYALTESCGLPSDMFSIGVMIFSLYNNGKPLYECKNQLSSFRKNAEELRKWRGQLLGKVPDELQEIVKLLLNTEPAVRPDPSQLSKINFFEDVGSMTLQYMDSLFQQDNLQKSKFFKGLPKIIVKLPKRVNLQRILPPLFKECVNPDMIPFALPNILQIAEQSSDKEYTTHILPELIPMFKITAPVQILLIFMQNMNLLLKKTPQSDIKAHVLPMIYRALECDNPQIQELCLNIIPTFAELIDYPSLKNSVVPRIKKLCLSTSVLGIRVNSLLCLGNLLEHMDRWFVLDEVLPLLPQVPTREPAVLMSILGIYQVALTHSKLGITKDLLAGKVLPFLIPVAIDHNLNLSQFNAYMTLIKDMIDRIVEDHRGKLEQLEQMKQEQKSLEITKITEQDDKTLISGISDNQPKSMMDKFLSGFGIAGLMGAGGGESKGAVRSASPGVGAASNSSKESPPAPPAKTTLTLEEKQRLAKQQEQQRFMKTQKPLQVKSSTAVSKPQPSKPAITQPKDLTSTLMTSNMRDLHISSATSKPSTGMTSGFTSGSLSMSGSGSMNNTGLANRTTPGLTSGSLGMSAGSSMMGQSSYGMPSNTNSQNSFGGQSSMRPQNVQTNKQVNMSAFDSLMPSSSAPKPTLNQMNQNMSLGQQSIMGNQSMMGNQGMVRNQGMMGNSGMIGQQGMMGSSGMMGNQGMMGTQGVMGQPSMMGSQMNSGFGGQPLNTGFNSSAQQVRMNSAGGMGMFPSQPIGSQNLMQSQPMTSQNTSSYAATDLNDLFG